MGGGTTGHIELWGPLTEEPVTDSGIFNVFMGQSGQQSTSAQCVELQPGTMVAAESGYNAYLSPSGMVPVTLGVQKSSTCGNDVNAQSSIDCGDMNMWMEGAAGDGSVGGSFQLRDTKDFWFSTIYNGYFNPTICANCEADDSLPQQVFHWWNQDPNRANDLSRSCFVNNNAGDSNECGLIDDWDFTGTGVHTNYIHTDAADDAL